MNQPQNSGAAFQKQRDVIRTLKEVLNRCSLQHNDRFKFVTHILAHKEVPLLLFSPCPEVTGSLSSRASLK